MLIILVFRVDANFQSIFFFYFFFFKYFTKDTDQQKNMFFFLSAKRVNQSMYHYHIEQTKRRKRL